jgi:hypothetical protein
VSACAALIEWQLSGVDLISSGMTAFWTLKTIGPFHLIKVVVTGFLGIKLVLKLK